MSSPRAHSPGGDRQARIIEAALTLLSTEGIAGVSMRAVSREAGVALGLVNYYFADKASLIKAALHSVGERDLAILEPDPSLPPVERLRRALMRVGDAEFLTTEHLSLRLQLWALAQVNEEFAAINTAAHKRYRDALGSLIQAAMPNLTPEQCALRASDIDIIQNGVWLTSLLGRDDDLVRRSLARTVEIALAD